jgi:hypothetical protein
MLTMVIDTIFIILKLNPRLFGGDLESNSIMVNDLLIADSAHDFAALRSEMTRASDEAA